MLRLALWAFLLCIVYFFAFWHTPDQPASWWNYNNPNQPIHEYSNYLYWMVHPLGVLDIIGMFILTPVGFAYFSGGYMIFTGEQYVEKGEFGAINIAGFAAAAVGIAICYI